MYVSLATSAIPWAAASSAHTACLHEATAVEVTPATWRDFGDWGGIDVEALVSWGFFKHVALTIDFDRSRYLIDPPAHA